MPAKLTIQEGQRFGRLVVVKEVEPRKAHHGYERCFLCKCDCGNIITTLLRSLRFGRATSCGCYQRETASGIGKEKRKHPADPDGERIYSIWRGMKSRCFCKSNPAFQFYGMKGISVCDEWRDDFMKFYDWSMENGYKGGLTIDRIDGHGNYEPSNCRWATHREQSNNTKRNVVLSYNGESHTTAEWSRITGIGRTTLQSRIRKGWSDDKVLTTPVRGRKN